MNRNIIAGSGDLPSTESIDTCNLEETMRKPALMLAVAALLATPLAAAPASAAPVSPEALRGAVGFASPIETVQYIYGGRNYCFYPDGWRGPGWYWCGYRLRRGYGWGGGYGWRGWSHGGWHGGRHGGHRHGGHRGRGGRHHR
jgi:hypothetical protein